MALSFVRRSCAAVVSHSRTGGAVAAGGAPLEAGRAAAAATAAGPPPPPLGDYGAFWAAVSEGAARERARLLADEDEEEERRRRRNRERRGAEAQRSLRVALLGAPNAGKSELTNALVGAAVTAVSPKTNTTRVATLGSVTVGDAQLVLSDTPGVVGREHVRDRSHSRKVQLAWDAACRADHMLFIVDAERQLRTPDPRVPRLVARLADEMERHAVAGEGTPRSALVLNKADLLPRAERPAMLHLARELGALHAFDDVYFLSAKQRQGTDELLERLLEAAVPRPWEMGPDERSDLGEAGIALEVVRSQFFRRLHQELPYAVEPVHVSWEDFRNGSVRIEQDLVVDSERHRKIVVGGKGAAIGQVGRRARLVLESAFNRRVHLILNVVVDARRRRLVRESATGP